MPRFVRTPWMLVPVALVILLVVTALVREDGLFGIGEDGSKDTSSSVGPSPSDLPGEGVGATGPGQDGPGQDGPGEDGPGSGPTGDGPGALPPEATIPPDYVYARLDGMTQDDPNQLADCDLARGSSCRFRFDGSYRLSTVDTASIRAAVFENDSADPVLSTELRIPRRGSNRFFIELPNPQRYTIPDDVAKLRLQTFLVRTDGTVMFEGYSFSFDVS